MKSKVSQFVLLFSFLVFVSPGHTAPGAVAPGSFAVRQIKQVPPAVRTLLPRYARSVFFGIAPLGANKRDIFLSYYTVPNHHVSNDEPDERLEYLALFERQASSQPGKTAVSFHRLSTIDLMGDETVWFRHNVGSTQFTQFTLRWLRPKQQSGPILILTNDAVNGGGLEEYLFITFPKGLRGKPTLQAFGSGDNGSSWVETTYSEVDQRGYMVINETGGAMNSGEATGYTTRYHWDGTRFTSGRE